MTEIVISIRPEHERQSLAASIRVSVSAPQGTRETPSPQFIAGGLGDGPLPPDSRALPCLSYRFIINVESGFDRRSCQTGSHANRIFGEPS